MAGRTFHNLINSLVLGGFSGNELHAYMDRAARRLHAKHRNIGHDNKALLEMILLFRDRYSIQDIVLTYLLHTRMDNFMDGVQTNVRHRYKRYGKKSSISNRQQIINLMSRL